MAYATSVYGIVGPERLQKLVNGDMGWTGAAEFTQKEFLSNENSSISYNPYTSFMDEQVENNKHLTISGNLKQVSLLVLQEVIRRQEISSYQYEGKTYTPSHIYWGPFIFDLENALTPVRVSYSYIKYSDEESQMIDLLSQEINKLKKIKIFLSQI